MIWSIENVLSAGVSVCSAAGVSVADAAGCCAVPQATSESSINAASSAEMIFFFIWLFSPLVRDYYQIHRFDHRDSL